MMLLTTLYIHGFWDSSLGRKTAAQPTSSSAGGSCCDQRTGTGTWRLRAVTASQLNNPFETSVLATHLILFPTSFSIPFRIIPFALLPFGSCLASGHLLSFFSILALSVPCEFVFGYDILLRAPVSSRATLWTLCFALNSSVPRFGTGNGHPDFATNTNSNPSVRRIIARCSLILYSDTVIEEEAKKDLEPLFFLDFLRRLSRLSNPPSHQQMAFYCEIKYSN